MTATPMTLTPQWTPAPERVERARNRARQFGMADIDAGIDHRDLDLLAGRERLRFGQTQLCQRVLERRLPALVVLLSEDRIALH